jgi:hypothetical protein
MSMGVTVLTFSYDKMLAWQRSPTGTLMKTPCVVKKSLVRRISVARVRLSSDEQAANEVTDSNTESPDHLAFRISERPQTVSMERTGER